MAGEYDRYLAGLQRQYAKQIDEFLGRSGAPKAPNGPVQSRVGGLAASQISVDPGVNKPESFKDKALNTFINVVDSAPVKTVINTLSTPLAFTAGATDRVVRQLVSGEGMDGDNIYAEDYDPNKPKSAISEAERNRVEKLRQESRDNPLNIVGEAIQAGAENVSNQWQGKPTVYNQDVLRSAFDPDGSERDKANAMYGVAGFGLDMIADPLNLVGGAIGRAAGKGVEATAAAAREAASVSDNLAGMGANIARGLIDKPMKPGSIKLKNYERAIADEQAAKAKVPEAVNSAVDNAVPSAVPGANVADTVAPEVNRVSIADRAEALAKEAEKATPASLAEGAESVEELAAKLGSKPKPDPRALKIPDVFRERVAELVPDATPANAVNAVADVASDGPTINPKFDEYTNNLVNDSKVWNYEDHEIPVSVGGRAYNDALTPEDTALLEQAGLDAEDIKNWVEEDFTNEIGESPWFYPDDLTDTPAPTNTPTSGLTREQWLGQVSANPAIADEIGTFTLGGKEVKFSDFFQATGNGKLSDLLKSLGLPANKTTVGQLRAMVPSILEEALKRAGITDEVAQAAPNPAPAASQKAAKPEPGWTSDSKTGNLPANMEKMDKASWTRVQRSLYRANKNNFLGDEEYKQLMEAWRTENPVLWRQVADSVMYEGNVSGIDANARRAADEMPEVIAEAEQAAAKPGDNAPGNIVDPTEEIAQDVDPEWAEQAREALEATLKEEFDLKRLTHIEGPTRTGAQIKPGTADTSRTARYFEAFGRFPQYTLWKNLMSKMNTRLKNLREGAKFAEQGYRRMDEIMPALRAHAKWLDANGIPPTLGTERGIPMSTYDVLSVLEGKSRTALNQMLFQPSKDIPLTNVLEAVENVLKQVIGKSNRPDEELIRDVMATLKKPSGKLQKGENNFAVVGKSRIEAAYGKPGSPQRNGWIKKVGDLSDNELGQRLFNRELRQYAELIVDAKDEFFNVASVNAAKYGIEVGQEADTIAKEVAEQAIAAASESDSTFLRMVNALSDIDKKVDEAGTEIGAKAEAIIRAEEKVEEAIAESVPQEVVEAVSNANKAREAVKTADPEKINKVQQEIFENTTAKAQANVSIAELKDWEMNHTRAIESGIQQRYGKLAEWFIRDHGMENIGQAVSRMRSVLRPMRAEYRDGLNRMTKKWDGKQIEGLTDNVFKTAFRHIQSGKAIDEITNDTIREAVEDIRPLVDFFFNTERGVLDDELLNRFVLHGMDLEMVNAAFAAKGFVTAGFDMKAAAKGAKGDKTKIAANLAQQWRSWNIDDPAEFLSVAENALNHMATIDATIRQGISTAKALGLTSNKPKPGYVKYHASKFDIPVKKGKKQFDSNVNHYWPDDLYVRADIAREFAVMDRVLGESLIPDSRFGTWVANYMLPIMNIWKSGMTIWNPRHWFRNGYGDISLNYLAGVTDPRLYIRSMRIMHARGDYGMWDGLSALKDLGHREARELAPGEAALTIARRDKKGKAIAGSEIEVSVDDLYEGLRARGALVAYPVREALMDDMMNLEVVERYRRKMSWTGGRAKEMVSKSHEWRDHMIRISHALDVMQKGSFKSIDDALDEAAKQVRYWHPDGSDLTHMENKYMRTIFPFYSWTRRSLPLVVEAMLTQPHRYMAYPKAYYNFAESMGIDLTSLSDPFPVDALFPDFISERMTGPLYEDENGDYIGFSPGVVQDDMSAWLGAGGGLSNVGWGPANEVLGMLSPAIKTPLEMITGNRIGLGKPGDGVPINDFSDHIDSQIPVVNQFAGMTGISPTGTLDVFNLLPNEQRVEAGKGIIDRNNNVDRGLQSSGVNLNAIFNWLTGLGRVNMTPDNYVNLAETQKAEAALRESRMRNGG